MSQKTNKPSYWKFLWKVHKSKLFLSLGGIAMCIKATPALIEAFNDDAALIPVIGGFIAIYGFTIAITYLPYHIYRGLNESNYWENNSI